MYGRADVCRPLIACVVLEFRCLFRNRRPRSTAISFLLLFLCIHVFLHIAPAIGRMTGADLNAGIELYLLLSFASGGVTVFCGVFLIPWASSSIGFIIAAPLPLTTVIGAKFLFLACLTALFSGISALNVAIIGRSAASGVFFAFWHMTWTGSCALLLTANNREKVDLQRGTFKNFQSYGVTYYILMWVLAAFPAVFHQFINTTCTPGAGALIRILVCGVGIAVAPLLLRRSALRLGTAGRQMIESSFEGDDR